MLRKLSHQTAWTWSLTCGFRFRSLRNFMTVSKLSLSPGSNPLLSCKTNRLFSSEEQSSLWISHSPTSSWEMNWSVVSRDEASNRTPKTDCICDAECIHNQGGLPSTSLKECVRLGRQSYTRTDIPGRWPRPENCRSRKSKLSINN